MNAGDIEAAFKWLCGIVWLGFMAWNGWLMKNISNNAARIDLVENLIRAHELEDSRMYVSKQDFKDTVVEMKDTVKRSHERLDTMAGNIGEIKSLVVQAVSAKHP